MGTGTGMKTWERGSIYPSWRYHPDGRSTLCTSPDEDDALGEEWSDRDVRWTQVDPEPVKRGRKAKA